MIWLICEQWTLCFEILVKLKRRYRSWCQHTGQRLLCCQSHGQGRFTRIKRLPKTVYTSSILAWHRFWISGTLHSSKNLLHRFFVVTSLKITDHEWNSCQHQMEASELWMTPIHSLRDHFSGFLNSGLFKMHTFHITLSTKSSVCTFLAYQLNQVSQKKNIILYLLHEWSVNIFPFFL